MLHYIPWKDNPQKSDNNKKKEIPRLLHDTSLYTILYTAYSTHFPIHIHRIFIWKSSKPSKQERHKVKNKTFFLALGVAIRI